jgi:putative addiction module component (TIGR02574 family)
MDSQEGDEGLSTSEKILRLQDQLDEIAGSPEDLELTPEQFAELRRRLNDHRLDPRHYKTWEEIRAELESLGRHDPD